MSSQERIRRLDEDWTAVTDPAVRKKLQNKLNQRALRARTRHEKQALILQAKKSRADRPHSYALILPRPHPVQGPRRPTTLAEAVVMMTRFNAAAYERYYAADPCLDHLFTLSKFNVLRAFTDNMAALGLSIQTMEEEDAISPFSTNFSTNKHNQEILPASLFPTTTQCSTPHHPWLDCFPFPRMRDNLVNASESFNDCELCTDIMDPASGDVGIMVWGDPWLPQSWEVSQLFVHKWSWVIKGCPEIFVHSNYWRARRGLQKLKASSI